MKVTAVLYSNDTDSSKILNIDGRKKIMTVFKDNPMVKTIIKPGGGTFERRNHISYWKDWTQVDLVNSTYIGLKGDICRLN